MPRKKKVIDDSQEPLARLPVAVEYGGAALQSPTDERRERELEDVLEEVGSDGRIRVWHIIDAKSVYAGEMSLEGFSLDALLDNYGGGDKTLVFYQGKKRVETLRVTLDPSLPPTNPREQRLAKRDEKNGAGGQGTGLLDMASFMASMAQSQMSNMDMFSKMMMMMQTSSQATMQAMTAMLTARPEKDPTELAIKMAELMKPNGNGGGGSAAELLTVFREGVKMATDLSGKDNDDDGTTGLIRDGLGVVGKALEAARPPQVVQVQAPPQQRALPNPSTLPIVPTPPATPPADDPTAPHANDRPWIVAARPMIPRLAAALAFLSGDSAAVELLRRADDNVVQDLMDDVDDETPPGFIGRVTALFPAFKPSPEWSEQFVETLRANVTAEDEGDDERPDEDEAGEPQELIDAARSAARQRGGAK